MAAKKLYRSRTDKMIGGVAGGLANYLNIDSTIARVLFVISVFLGGGGILAYIILWIVIPEEPFVFPHSDNLNSESQKDSTNPGSSESKQNYHTQNINSDGSIETAKDNKKILGGSILIIIGTLFLLDNVLPRFDAGDYWSVILIIIGVAIIIKSYNN
jgi:phage shock protein PspC (stress-responsive transcriptional regulator)